MPVSASVQFGFPTSRDAPTRKNALVPLPEAWFTCFHPAGTACRVPHGDERHQDGPRDFPAAPPPSPQPAGAPDGNAGPRSSAAPGPVGRGVEAGRWTRRGGSWEDGQTAARRHGHSLLHPACRETLCQRAGRGPCSTGPGCQLAHTWL